MSMRTLSMRVLGWSAVAGSLLVGSAAGAGTLYRWTTESGSVAYADDLKRVPERYRDRVDTVTSEALADYGRLTPTDPVASQEYADRLAERLEGLREAAAEAEGDYAAGERLAAREPAPERSNGVSGLALQSTRETVGRRRVLGSDGRWHWVRTTRSQIVDAPTPTLSVDRDPDGGPVVVEKLRVIDDDGFTRHVTVVRQGDRVLNVIKGRQNHGSSDFPRESDLER